MNRYEKSKQGNHYVDKKSRQEAYINRNVSTERKKLYFN